MNTHCTHTYTQYKWFRDCIELNIVLMDCIKKRWEGVEVGGVGEARMRRGGDEGRMRSGKVKGEGVECGRMRRGGEAEKVLG